MSNDYFNNIAPLARHTVARAEAVNTKLSDVAAGFDLLPGADRLVRGAVNFAATTGTANNYVAAMPKTWTDYQDGATCWLRINATNTGASTLDVDGLGTRSIKTVSGAAMEAGDLISGGLIGVIYDNATSSWVLILHPRTELVDIEAARVAALADLAEIEDNVELMEAAVVESTGLDVSLFNIGDLLQVVDVGSGVKGLELSAQRLENSVAFTGTTPSLNIANDQYHYGTLTGNTTFTFNVADFGALSGNVIFFMLEITQDSTLRTITFPASVEWRNGLAPDAPATDATSLYTFATRDGGTTWRASYVGTGFA